jgi:hypothetical protein
VAEIEADIEEIESSLSRLARDHYIDGRLPEGVFRSTHDELSHRLEDLRRSKTSAEEEASLRALSIRPGSREDIEVWWDQASLPDRRDALSRAIHKVVIHPAKVRGGNRFDSDRVEIKWSWDVYARIMDSQWDKLTSDQQAQAIELAEQDDLALEQARTKNLASR